MCVWLEIFSGRRNQAAEEQRRMCFESLKGSGQKRQYFRVILRVFTFTMGNRVVSLVKDALVTCPLVTDLHPQWF